MARRGAVKKQHPQCRSWLVAHDTPGFTISHRCILDIGHAGQHYTVGEGEPLTWDGGKGTATREALRATGPAGAISKSRRGAQRGS